MLSSSDPHSHSFHTPRCFPFSILKTQIHVLLFLCSVTPMAKFSRPSSFLVLGFLFFGLAVAQNAPEIPPSPTPDAVADSPPPLAPSPFEGAPENSPAISPPAPPPADSPPDSSPADSPSSPPSTTPELPPAPSPSPGQASDFSEKEKSEAGNQSKGGSGGMNVGKKAGIAVGVIAAVCLVGIGGFVYKKRRDNIRRTQYGFAARREIL